MDITKLPDKWLNYRGDYTDDELTDEGKVRVGACEEMAQELRAALPVWTKITEDSDTRPETDREGYSKDFYFLCRHDMKAPLIGKWKPTAVIGYYWRPLIPGIDTPPDESQAQEDES